MSPIPLRWVLAMATGSRRLAKGRRCAAPWSLDSLDACRCGCRVFIAHLIAHFIVGQALFDQPETKPRSIDAIGSREARNN